MEHPVMVDNAIDDIQAQWHPKAALSWAKFFLVEALREGQFEKSVYNCHTPGLDSVVLFDSEHGMVRFYTAHAGMNMMHNLYGPDGHFTIGVHNHKYRICKIPLVGPIINIRTARDDWGPGNFGLYEYRFKSALRGEEFGVEELGLREMRPLASDLLVPGDHVVMDPEDLHTVLVNQNTTTTWMVLEGKNVDIEPLIYSPRPNLTLSDDGLYEPMPEYAVKKSIVSTLTEMPPDR